MKNQIITILLMLAVAITASARDRLYINNFFVQPGQTLQVPVILLNDTAYSGFQTDLYLPEGLSLDTEDDEYIIDLTERSSRYHIVSSNRLSDNSIRIFVSSSSAKEFSGNNGAIVTLSLTASADFTGPAEVYLKNTICAESIGTKHYLKDETCKVNDNSGDVNGDGEINIADINAIIDLILSDEFTNSGDVNHDGEINIADINAVIDRILTTN